MGSSTDQLQLPTTDRESLYYCNFEHKVNCPENVSFIPSISPWCMSLWCCDSRETLIIFPWASSWIGISSPLSVWFIGVPLKQGMNGEWTGEEKERSNNDLQLQLRSEITRLQGHQLRSEVAKSKKQEAAVLLSRSGHKSVTFNNINPGGHLWMILVPTCSGDGSKEDKVGWDSCWLVLYQRLLSSVQVMIDHSMLPVLILKLTLL